MMWPSLDPQLWGVWRAHANWLSYASWFFWAAVAILGVIHIARGWARIVFSEGPGVVSGWWEVVKGLGMWFGFDLWVTLKAYLHLRGG